MHAGRIGRSCFKVMPTSNPNISLKMVKAAKPPILGRKYTMFQHEMSLPRLPVPPLQQTMEKYLLSVKPLLSDEEFACTKSAVDEFRKPGGAGEFLQEKLVSRSNKMENWLAEWWDDVAYLSYENPVVVHSSPGISFPKQTFATKLDQLRFCAKAIRSILNFKSFIDSERLPVDMQGKDPLTMVQYCKLLSTCRIPHHIKDYSLRTPAYQSRHIVVMCNNQVDTNYVYQEGRYFFKKIESPGSDKIPAKLLKDGIICQRLAIVFNAAMEKGTFPDIWKLAFEMDVYRGDDPLSESELLGQLNAIVEMSSSGGDYPAVGAFTASDRRLWGKIYRKLKRDSTNMTSLGRIIESVFVLCIDKSHGKPAGDPAVCEDPQLTISANQMLHGGGTELNSCNRWFDKIFQLVVSEDGIVGCNYEHSSAEGPPVQKLCNHIMHTCSQNGNKSAMPATYFTAPRRLDWKLSSELLEKLEAAKDSIDHLVDDVDLRGFRYTGCGKNVPKANKISPDAFFQIGLQLTYFRLHGHMAPTYESASTRMFRLGRTDTIRSASLAAKAFCEAMQSAKMRDSEKKDLFLKAVSRHTKYTREAINGQAIDRHLLGLKLICMESGIRLPEIYRDKGYNYSLHFKLSTSQVPSPFETLLCFGPVVPDGYGVCYNPLETCFTFAVSASNSNPGTNAGRFGEALKTTFDDIQKLLVQPKL